MNKILILLTLTTLLITGCTINDKNHNIAEGFEITDKSETTNVYEEKEYFPDEDMLSEYLDSAIENREHKESLFILTCSVKYQNCSTLEINLEDFKNTGNVAKNLEYKETKAEYISYPKEPYYIRHNFNNSEYKMISFSHEFFIFEDMKKVDFGENGNVAFPKGINVQTCYDLNINENYISKFADKGYFGLIAVDKGKNNEE